MTGDGGPRVGVRVSDAGPGPPSVALKLAPASWGGSGPHFSTSNLIPIPGETGTFLIPELCLLSCYHIITLF